SKTTRPNQQRSQAPSPRKSVTDALRSGSGARSFGEPGDARARIGNGRLRNARDWELCAGWRVGRADVPRPGPVCNGAHAGPQASLWLVHGTGHGGRFAAESLNFPHDGDDPVEPFPRSDPVVNAKLIPVSSK